MDSFCEGDSYLLHNVIDCDLAKTMFELIRDEIEWNKMDHRGGPVPRLISVQCDKEIDKEPIYRHPVDEYPPQIMWTPIVHKLKDAISEKLKQPFNHCLVQWYKGGLNYISEHSDKTLDMLKDSNVVNLSLGATRTMVLKKKIKNEKGVKEIVRIILPHNSLFVLGWKTNQMWTHSIQRDKRMDSIKKKDELAFGSHRISLTLRTIATFMTSDGKLYGQGSKCKQVSNLTENHAIDNDNLDEALEMLKAFSKENKDSDFDWNTNYGKGFNVLNLKVLN